jgi:ribosomal-protein-alanine N-acetyltransferase
MNEAIREMSLDDLDDVMEIEKKSFVSPWTKRFFEEALISPISVNLVMKKDSETLGYIILYSVADEAHILNIAVHPSHRGKGCASSLIQYVLGYFERKGVHEFFLEVREGNMAAIRLYKRFGFEKIGKRKKYYTETNEDALVMCLSVHQFGVESSEFEIKR